MAGARDPLLADLINRVYSVPFVAPRAVAFNRVPLDEIFPILMSGHHQHMPFSTRSRPGSPKSPKP